VSSLWAPLRMQRLSEEPCCEKAEIRCWAVRSSGQADAGRVIRCVADHQKALRPSGRRRKLAPGVAVGSKAPPAPPPVLLPPEGSRLDLTMACSWCVL